MDRQIRRIDLDFDIVLKRHTTFDRSKAVELQLDKSEIDVRIVKFSAESWLVDQGGGGIKSLMNRRPRVCERLEIYSQPITGIELCLLLAKRFDGDPLYVRNACFRRDLRICNLIQSVTLIVVEDGVETLAQRS